LPITRAGATSSNSLVLFGRRLLMKLFRRIEPGVNPDVEIGRYFTDAHPFGHTPKLAATLELVRDGQFPCTLAIVQQLVRHQGDGWEHAIAELGRYFRRASGQARGPDPLPADDRPLLELVDQDPPLIALEAIGSYLHAATVLGRRTAEMHLALAEEAEDPAFRPEPLSEQDLQLLLEDIHEQSEQAIAAIQTHLTRLPEETASAAESLLQQLPRVLERMHGQRPSCAGLTKIRCHGDYHLGQVLWADNDYVILDFEGEPTRTVEERRAKQSPLRDVAGMLRSYNYAAYAGLFAYAKSHPDDFRPLEPWAALWQRWISAAFLRSYFVTTGGDDRLRLKAAGVSPMLNLLLLDKALYELSYELNNRPDWVRIPLAGILQLITTL
jgi:maltose alpha-D-glucosyltransferase/alpha-amylase